MDKVFVGKIVTTHGIKGEVRIISDFPYKDRVFVKGNKLIIGEEEYSIDSYRKHKMYDMVLFKGYSNINDIGHLLKKKVYIDKFQLNLKEDEVLDEDLLQYKVLTNKNRSGIIKEIFFASPHHKILRIEIDHKETLVPYSKEFITNIDKDMKEITIKLIGGMLDEN